MDTETCPGCGHPGWPVGEETLGALLNPQALARRQPACHRFCPAPACRVVYFGAGDRFQVEDLSVPVFQKEPPGDRMVCYCFGVTEADVSREAALGEAGASLRRIRELVRQDRCACELRNPQGSCCLAHVAGLTHAGGRR